MIYPWKRYWVRQGEIPSLREGLFIEPSSEIKWLGSISNGVPLSDLNDVPCLVLRGDVGMGKSTTIRDEADKLQANVAGQKHAVVCHDLKRLSEAQIERRIFESPEFKGWLGRNHALTLFLDSLDECWRRIQALEELLADEFERQMRTCKDPLPLFLRLTL